MTMSNQKRVDRLVRSQKCVHQLQAIAFYRPVSYKASRKRSRSRSCEVSVSSRSRTTRSRLHHCEILRVPFGTYQLVSRTTSVFGTLHSTRIHSRSLKKSSSELQSISTLICIRICVIILPKPDTRWGEVEGN